MVKWHPCNRQAVVFGSKGRITEAIACARKDAQTMVVTIGQRLLMLVRGVVAGAPSSHSFFRSSNSESVGPKGFPPSGLAKTFTFLISDKLESYFRCRNFTTYFSFEFFLLL